MVLMRNAIFILASVMLIAAVSCKKDENPVDYKAKLPGEWHYVSEDLDVDIYASFDENGDFHLYQQLGEGRHRHYSGSWTVNGNTLSGTYEGGEPWGSSYSMSFSDDDTMTLTALNGSDESNTYVRDDIPSEVKDQSIDVKSSSLRMLNSQPQYRWL